MKHPIGGRTRPFAVVLLAWALLWPRVVRADRVDQYVTREMARRRIPGLALAVVRDGKLLKARGYGVADVENDVPVTIHSIFELASITKQFTAAAILLLAEKGRLNLDDSICRHLPETPAPPAAWQGIRVRHLLTHTAGLAAMGNDFRGVAWTDYVRAETLYAAVMKEPLEAKPGERWQYSDEGYFLLGMIIEKASHQLYGAFLADSVFRPLGMNETSVLDLVSVLKHRVHGYTILDGQLVNIRRVSQVGLASYGGVFSSVADLAKWDAGLGGTTFLAKASREAMWTPVTLADGRRYPYGFGWWLGDRHGHRFTEHNGITGTEITRFIDDKLTVIVLTNLGTWGQRTPQVRPYGLTKGVAEFFIPTLGYPAIADRDPKATAAVNAFFADLANPEPDAALFTGGCLRDAKAAWTGMQALFNPLGVTLSISPVEYRETASGRSALYRVAYRDRSFLSLISFDLQGRIAGFDTNPE